MELYNDNKVTTINVLTLPQLCNRLNIGRNTAYSLLNSGKIKGFKLGKSWRIPEESIQAFLKKMSFPI